MKLKKSSGISSISIANYVAIRVSIVITSDVIITCSCNVHHFMPTVRKRAPEESLNGCSPKVSRLEGACCVCMYICVMTCNTLITLALHTPLLKFRPKLADFYSKKPEVPEGTWPPVKKTQYISLALIRKQAINYANEYARQTIQGSIDDIINDKEKIAYEDVFNELDDGALVILEGRPGCGKTTLMHKLSQDWEKRKLLASHLFILVHFRRFCNRSDIKLSDILQAASMNFTDEEIKQLCTYIEENSGRGVVFALDGLDEYSPQSKNNVLYNLIKREYLPNSVVIVASRPAASQKFRKYATKHVEVIGFLVPQIEEYVVNYFTGRQDKAQGLLKYLDNHLNVMHMCYLPLHTAMVTYLYDVEGADIPQTETEIYRHFTLWTLIRTFRRRSDDEDMPLIIRDFDHLPSDDKKVFDLILRLAYTATIESKQVFTLEEVEQCISGQLPGSGTDENCLGLIVIDRYFVKYGLDQTYTFIHFTFQEFLAACYIANQEETVQTSILKQYGSVKRLAEMWKFFCGISKCSLETFKLLLDKTSEVQRKNSKKELSNTLLQIHCAYESQQEEMCSQVVETYSCNISLHNQSLNPSNMTALGYVVVNSKPHLKELSLTSCHIGPECLSALVAGIEGHTLAIETLRCDVMAIYPYNVSFLCVIPFSFRGSAITAEMGKVFAVLLSACPSIKNLK